MRKKVCTNRMKKKKKKLQGKGECKEDGFILSKFCSFEMGLHHLSKVNCPS
jgi:hypothetical protein